MVFDSQLLVEIPKCVVMEMFSIIIDEDSKDSKAANDAFLDEVSNVFSQ